MSCCDEITQSTINTFEPIGKLAAVGRLTVNDFDPCTTTIILVPRGILNGEVFASVSQSNTTFVLYYQHIS